MHLRIQKMLLQYGRCFTTISLLLLATASQVLADPPESDDLVRVLTKRLTFLQKERDDLVKRGFIVVDENQTIRRYVLSSEFQAMYLAAIAHSTPQFTETTSVINNQDGNPRSSGATAKDRDTVTTSTTFVDNSPMIAALEIRAHMMYIISLYQREALAESNEVLQKLLDDIGNNLQNFRRETDPLSLRTREEHLAIVELTTDWVVRDRFDVGAMLTRGMAMRALGRDQEAMQDLQKAAEFPTAAAPIAFAAYGHSLFVKGNEKEAMKNLNIAVRLAGKYKAEEAYLLRALVHRAANRIPDAQSDLDSAIRLNPNCVQAHRLYSLFVSTMPLSGRKPGKALDWAKKANALGLRKNWSALEALAIAEYQGGNTKEALAALDKAAELACGWQAKSIAHHRKTIEANQPIVIDWKAFSAEICGVGKEKER